MENLLKPIKVCGTEIKNRIVMAPLVCFNVSGCDGVITQPHIDHYIDRAKSGTGLIVLEAICTRPEGRLHSSQLGIWSDRFIDALAKCADGCHEYGSVLIAQIHHAGMSTNEECGRKVGPIKNGDCRVLSTEDIHFIRQSFIDASVRLKKAGFDGVQLHGCHRYLLNSFSNRSNDRDDGYGGDAHGRTRFAREILAGIKKECGDDFIVTIRMAGNDPDLKDGIMLAEQYINAGFDMLSVSAGIGKPEDLDVPEDYPFSDISFRAANIKKQLNPKIPIGAVGGFFDLDACEKLVGDGYADFAEIGRGMLADSNFAIDLYEQGQENVKCFDCKSGCKWFKPGYKRCPAYVLRVKNGRSTP